jgi:hypothetical protein
MEPLEEVSHYEPKIPPSRIPELDAYYNLPFSKQLESQKNGFFINEPVKGHLDSKWIAELYNRDSFKRIYELYLAYPELRSSLTAKLSQFKGVLKNTCHPFKVLKLNFADYPFEEASTDPDIDWEE